MRIGGPACGVCEPRARWRRPLRGEFIGPSEVFGLLWLRPTLRGEFFGKMKERGGALFGEAVLFGAAFFFG